MFRKLYHSIEFMMLRQKTERLMDGEIEYHIEQETLENMRRGMSRREARRAALQDFGGVARIREECREAWGTELAGNLYRDLLFALRGLRKNFVYTFAVVITLALGIGSNTALFSVLRSVVLRPLPIRDGDRVVMLERVDQKNITIGYGFSFPEMEFYRRHSPALEDIAEFHRMSFTLLGHGDAQNVDTAVVGANYFDFMGLKALHGRTFLPGEDAHGAAPVMVLSHRYFLANFAGDASVVGTTVRLNDRVHTIVGVLPPIPEFPARTDVYMPTSSCGTRSNPDFLTSHGSGLLRLYGRLKPSVTVEQAQRDFEGAVARYREAYPESDAASVAWSPHLALLSEEIAKNARPTFLLLFGITGLVLLIACASVANLSLARALRRRREVAIRTALGASRARLFQQFVIEGLLVSLAGGLVGLASAVAALQLLAAFAARFSVRAYDVRLDPVVLWFCVIVSVLTGVFACAIPAWRSRVPLMAGTKDGAAGSNAGSSQQWARQLTRRMLVSAQVAFSVAVLIAAGLLLRSLIKLQEVNPGFEAQHVFAMRLHPNWSRINDPETFRALFRKVLDEVRQMPGVIAAGVSGTVPLDRSGALSRELDLEEPPAVKLPVTVSVASPGYFAALRVPLLRGRDFRDTDREGAPVVAIVNQTLAKRRWPDADPLGKRFRIRRLFGLDDDTWITVVGVAGDMRSARLDREPADEVFLSFEQASAGTDVVIRTGTDLVQSIQNARKIVARVDPETALVSVRTMEEIVADNLAAPQLTTQLLGLLAALTLVITVTGIGGVAAVAASQRRAELGIRLALGARPRALIAMVVGQEMRMVLAGLAVGLIAALAFARVLGTFLFGVPPTDPFTFATVAVLMLCVAVVACLIPAIRAARVDPFETLRSD
ncbi:MAG TPA: ABC transporter permease [Bryobacteraceae bacterium]|jgi:predicted permease|nr:ABC transporter permease [Bryobacteraceae bacterium]